MRLDGSRWALNVSRSARRHCPHTGQGRTLVLGALARRRTWLGLLGAKIPSRQPTQIHSRALPLVDWGSPSVRRGPCADAVRAAEESGVARMCTWSVSGARRQPAQRSLTPCAIDSQPSIFGLKVFFLNQAFRSNQKNAGCTYTTF